jgi:hypothetical protein
MRLEVFSSKRGNPEPNLVAIQAADLDMLPTVLVCPLLIGEPVTAVRTTATFSNRKYTVLCDLARPINRRVLDLVGTLDDETSRRIIATFTLLLPR